MAGFDVDKLLRDNNDTKTIEQGGHIKNKGGRPKAATPKDKRITAYFTQEDWDKIVTLASSRSMSNGAYIASVILDELNKED